MVGGTTGRSLGRGTRVYGGLRRRRPGSPRAGVPVANGGSDAHRTVAPALRPHHSHCGSSRVEPRFRAYMRTIVPRYIHIYRISPGTLRTHFRHMHVAPERTSVNPKTRNFRFRESAVEMRLRALIRPPYLIRPPLEASMPASSYDTRSP
jgi:hypothetical protein